MYTCFNIQEVFFLFFSHVYLLVDSSTEAIQYAIHSQVSRRNLTDSEIIKAREALKRCVAHVKSDAQHYASSKKDEMELFNKSKGTIEKQRFVDDNATEEQKEEIKSGEKSYNAIYNNIKGTPVNPDKELAMSSRQISDETGKLHKNVLADCRNMFEALEKHNPNKLIINNLHTHGTI